MLEIFKKNPRFLIGAIVVHVLFIAIFTLGFHFRPDKRAGTTSPKTVEVTTVDERLVKKELDKLKATDEQEIRRKQELVNKRKAEEKRLKDLKEKRITEQKKEQERIALLEKQERELKEKQKKLKEKQAAEEKRLAELEKQRQLEEEKQDKERKKKELEEKMKAEAEQMAKEQQAAALRKAELQKQQTLMEKHMTLIENKVYQKWIKPPNIQRGLISELRVKLIPSGDVIDVQLIKSSGDAVYDKSCIQAVKAASPLPLPPAKEGLFETFRNLRLPMIADKKS